ncbi:short chain dehydrogenase atnD [Physcia stellaris]|nr:short chain dehydrogenase atnD [Physcia stellaris]
MSGSRAYPRPQPSDATQGRLSVDRYFEVPHSSQSHPTNRPLPAPSPAPSLQALKSTGQQHLERLPPDDRQQGRLTEHTYRVQRQNLKNLFEMYSKMSVTPAIRAQSLREAQYRLDSLDRQHAREQIHLAAEEHRLDAVTDRSKSIQERQRPQLREQPDTNPTGHPVTHRHRDHAFRSTSSAASPPNTASAENHASRSLLRDAFGDAIPNQRAITSRHRQLNDSVVQRSREVAIQGSSSSTTTNLARNTSKAPADAPNALPLPTADQRVPQASQPTRIASDFRSRLRGATAQRSSNNFVTEPALEHSPSRRSNYNPFGGPQLKGDSQTDRLGIHHAQVATCGKAALTDHSPHEFRPCTGSNLIVESPDKVPRRQQGVSSKFASSSIPHAEAAKSAVSLPPPPSKAPVNNSEVDNNNTSTVKRKISWKGMTQPGNPVRVDKETSSTSTTCHIAKPNLKLDTTICNSFPDRMNMKEDVTNIMDLPISRQADTIKVAVDEANPEAHSNNNGGDNHSAESVLIRKKPVGAIANSTDTINNANMDVPSRHGTDVKLITESAPNSAVSKSPSILNGNTKLEDDLENMSLASDSSPSPDIDNQLDGTAWEKIDADGIEQDDEFYHQVANPQKVGWTEAMRRVWSVSTTEEVGVKEDTMDEMHAFLFSEDHVCAMLA